MKLVSMKLPPRDKTREEKMYPTMAGDGPEYPWGLCLTLDEKQLAALNLPSDLLEVGESVSIQAIGKVTSLSSNETQDGTNRSLGIQITSIGLAEQEAESSETGE